MKTARKIIRRILMIILGIFIAFVLFVVFCTVYSKYIYSKSQSNKTSETEAETKEITATDLITFNLTDTLEPVVLDTYWDSAYGKTYIYDNDYLDMVLDYDSVTREQLYAAIEENDDINEQFKGLLREYIDLVLDKYPDVDFRPLYENIKTLQIIEGDDELLLNSLSFDSYGCYRQDENAIYVKENFEFEKGTWAYQVIMHEISHCARSCWLNDGDVIIRAYSLDYSCTILEEALNSLFTVKIFDYEELDIAYQLQSNYNQVMIDCMDNYDYDDYMQHSLSYYLSKLDEFNGNINLAWGMIQLMEVQYNDYHDDTYELEQENYYLLYDYVADMYYRTHITDDMTYEEKTQVADDLIEKIMFDVPEEYHIDTEEFYRYLDEYVGVSGNDVD